jgi:hypothetical protein
VTVTRREFLASSSGALALTAVALAWPPARAGAALGAAAGGTAAGDPSSGAMRAGAIERQLRFRDGALRPVAWLRSGGAHRVALCDAEQVEITSPHRGRVRMRISDPRARDAIARALSPGVAREVLAEAARRRGHARPIA